MAVEGTLGVHILAVVLVRVQVSVQLLQCPLPVKPSLLHAAVDLKTVNSSLILDLLKHSEIFHITQRAGLAFFLKVSYAAMTEALSTACSDSQPPCHQ